MGNRIAIKMVALFLLGAAPSFVSAGFDVYYRANTASPWVLYSTFASKAVALDNVTDLQSLGYQAELVADGVAPSGSAVTSTSVYYPPSAYNNSSTYYDYSSGPGYSWHSHWWDHYVHHHDHGRGPHPHPYPHPTPHPHPHHHQHPAHHHHHLVYHHNAGHHNEGHHHHVVHHQHHATHHNARHHHAAHHVHHQHHAHAHHHGGHRR